MLKDSKILNEEDFFSLLFPKAGLKRAITALKMFNLACESNLTKESYKTVPQMLNITIPEYYSVLRKLRALGILEIHNHNFVPSRRFLRYLNEMYSYYEGMLKERYKPEETALSIIKEV